MKGTADEIWARRQEIRSCLVEGMRPEKIISSLGISRATLYRDLQDIRTEDSEWLEELAKGEFVHAYRLAIDSLVEDRKRLIAISESAKNDRDKIEAVRRTAEINVAMFNILCYGPMVLGLERRT